MGKSKVKRVRSKHSIETIKKMQEKRRSRIKQPRDGQSKKCQDFYSQLVDDYKNHPKKDEIMKWIEENKESLQGTKEDMKEYGICTEYSEMYQRHYFFNVGDLLYGDKVDSVIDFSNDPAIIYEQKEDLEEKNDD